MAHDPSHPPERAGGEPVIYIACPWTPVGGGMFKVADYLIQSQADPGQDHNTGNPPGKDRHAVLAPLLSVPVPEMVAVRLPS